MEIQEAPLGLRFATEIDAETQKQEADREKHLTWSPEVSAKVAEIIASYGSTTTRRTFSNQWDSSDWD